MTRFAVADHNHTIQDDQTFIRITSITATRRVTLPFSEDLTPGSSVTIKDESGSVSPTVLVQVRPDLTDEIDGSTAGIDMSTAYGILTFYTDGAGGWYLLGEALNSSGGVTGESSDSIVVADIAARDALTPSDGDLAITLDNGSGDVEKWTWDGSAWQSLGLVIGVAADIPYDNAASGLAGTVVQDAIDNLDTAVDGLLVGPVAHDLGGAAHNADTLANLNAKVSDATLIDTGDARLSDARTPTVHAVGGAEHSASTLAAVNALVSDATLIDTGDARLSDARTPTAHDLGGAEHNADTLANLNSKVSDATLIDTGDARLSDARTPTSHALAGAEHSASTLAALNGKIADGTLIDTADARLSDSRTCDNTFDDAATARSNLDVYSTSEVDTKVVGLYDHKGAYDAAANSPDLDSTPIAISKGDAYTVSVAGNFFAEAVEVGDVLIADQDSPTLLTHWTRVNKNISFGTSAGTACEGDDSRLSDARTPTAHDLGGAEHNADTLANLNLKVSDATLIDTGDSRLSDARTPTAHNLGGAEHSSDTLANLNSKVSDATLIDTGDSRLSDSRTCNNTFDNAATARATLNVYGYGCYYFSTPASTSLSATTPAKAAGTTTSVQTSSFTHSGSNRLTYTGTPTTVFEVSVTVSMTKASGGAALGSIHIAKGGSVVTGLRVDRTLANTTDEGALAVTGMVSLATNDYVELFVESNNGDDITVQSGTVSVRPTQ